MLCNTKTQKTKKRVDCVNLHIKLILIFAYHSFLFYAQIESKFNAPPTKKSSSSISIRTLNLFLELRGQDLRYFMSYIYFIISYFMPRFVTLSNKNLNSESWHLGKYKNDSISSRVIFIFQISSAVNDHLGFGTEFQWE